MNPFAENTSTTTTATKATEASESPAEEKDMVQIMEETRLKCLNMIEQAIAALSILGKETCIILPDALKYPREDKFEVVAIGMRKPSTYFWQKKKPAEPVFYLRSDYIFNDESYSRSKSVSFTEKELLNGLDRNGWWGRFLKANENFLSNLKIAIEEGKMNYYPNSPIKDLSWLQR